MKTIKLLAIVILTCIVGIIIYGGYIQLAEKNVVTVENEPNTTFVESFKKDPVSEAQAQIQKAMDELQKETDKLNKEMELENKRHDNEVAKIQSELDRITLVKAGFTSTSTPLNN